jgi:hypothetical protein
MKKFFSIFMLMALFITSVFAVDRYTIIKVTGNDVKFERNGEMVKASVGTTISTNVVIQVGLNCELVVCDDVDEFHIKGIIKQTDRKTLGQAIEETLNKNGLKKANGPVAANTVKKDKGPSNSVSTASSRASEAKEDLDWGE